MIFRSAKGNDFGLVLLFPSGSAGDPLQPPLPSPSAADAGSRGGGRSWRGALAAARPEALPHLPFSDLVSQHSVLSLPPRLPVGVDPPNKGPSLQPEALAQSQGCSLPPLKLHARWAFARSRLGTSRVAALRSQRCTFGKGQQVSGSAPPFLCPPPSYSLHGDEPPFPFGSCHPPCGFCEMQSPSSDVAYFTDFGVFPLVSLGCCPGQCL